MDRVSAQAKTAQAATHATGKAAGAAAGKAGSGLAVGLGKGLTKGVLTKGVLSKGALVGAIAARRAAWPALVVGTAFGGAAWFGVYELVTGVAEQVLPPPAQPEPRAHAAGLAVVPVAVGASAWAGWRVCPPMTQPPEQLLDLHGWAACARSLPLRHCGLVGLVSASTAAIACRVIQYRGGA